MIKFCSVAATLVLSLALSQAEPAQAGQMRKQQVSKPLSGRVTPGLQPGMTMPVLAPLDPTALNVNQAIMWQNSLHGEVN
ncbi:hypothetical protein [Methylorubrum populi]|uniref:Uncharacterized protein n=1 Tax=Methylorubrum populi TaxID=223967 RepID=A0A921JCP0_9HYPH|nr:hypothetical protein [Methylorubrum populi]